MTQMLKEQNIQQNKKKASNDRSAVLQAENERDQQVFEFSSNSDC